jgi:enoyl-CoA hydratase/carnithine racemase
MPIPPWDLDKEPLDRIIYEKRDHIAFITLASPERGNSIDRRMHSGLRGIWEDIKADPQVRVVVVTGAGERHFCTGADLSVPSEEVGRPGEGNFDEEIFWTSRHNHVWKPTICAVNGLVAGAGFHFIVDSDIVIAADHVAFTDTHVNVGIVSSIDGIGLAKKIPLGSALRLALVGRSYRMSVQRAHQLGLVEEVVPAEELASTAEQMAQAIAQNSPRAVSLTLQSIWNSLETSHSEANEYGWALSRMHWSHPDFTEGPRAFGERRDPVWQDA